jgi:hypothetical protein
MTAPERLANREAPLEKRHVPPPEGKQLAAPQRCPERDERDRPGEKPPASFVVVRVVDEFVVGAPESCHLRLGQHEITHYHRPAARIFKRHPRAEGKRRHHPDVSYRDVHIAARHAELVNAARQQRASSTHRQIYILPARVGGSPGRLMTCQRYGNDQGRDDQHYDESSDDIEIQSQSNPLMFLEVLSWITKK